MNFNDAAISDGRHRKGILGARWQNVVNGSLLDSLFAGTYYSLDRQKD